jgi:hypothetical protein
MTTHLIGETQSTACGQWGCNHYASTTDATLVTCKRCIKAIEKAKRTGRPTK